MQLNKLLHCLACFYLFILTFFFYLYLSKIWQTLNLVRHQTAPLVHRVQTMFFVLLEILSAALCVSVVWTSKIYLYTPLPLATSTLIPFAPVCLSLPLVSMKLSNNRFLYVTRFSLLQSPAIHARFMICFLVNLISSAFDSFLVLYTVISIRISFVHIRHSLFL